MRRTRRGKKRPVSKHLSISATDEEWEIVGTNAERRKKTKACYLVDLGLGKEGSELALNAGEQREMLEGLRSIRELMAQDDNGKPFIADMQARVAALFHGWASDMADKGRQDDLFALLAAAIGERQAAVVVEPYRRTANTSGRKPDSEGPEQGPLFD